MRYLTTSCWSFAFLFLSLIVTLDSCSNGKQGETQPADAVKATYAALNAHDSLGFLNSLSKDKRENYNVNPDAVSEILKKWKNRHADVRILSETHNDTVANILYDLKITGTDAKEHDSIRARAYKEGTDWRLGF